AGQDVVELVQQQQLPELVQPLGGVGGAGLAHGGGGQEFGIVQRPLALYVAQLDSGLRCVGSAVVFEVELAQDRRQVGGVGLQRSEELIAGGDGRARKALQVA